jgi:hypothetical protein
MMVSGQMLDEMEAALSPQGDKLAGADGMCLSLCETKTDLLHGSVSMFFAIQFKRRGRMATERDGWLIGKQKPPVRILKSFAKLWVMAGDGPRGALKDINREHWLCTTADGLSSSSLRESSGRRHTPICGSPCGSKPSGGCRTL